MDTSDDLEAHKNIMIVFDFLREQVIKGEVLFHGVEHNREYEYDGKSPITHDCTVTFKYKDLHLVP